MFFRFLAIFLAEFLYPSGGVNDFLLTGIERVADRAYFYMQGLAHCGAGLERVAATASYGDFLIIWMNFCFHGSVLDLYPSGRLRNGKAHIIL